MTPAKRILIVDDEPAILLLLEQLLSAEGYQVVTAADGHQAHLLARSQRFDLFLIDMIMPFKDGIETILSLRTLRSKAAIIAMSGGLQGGAGNYLPLAEKLGASASLAKPFNRQTLLTAVGSVLGAQGKVLELVPA